MPSWLILALAALVVWSVQRAVSKMALVELSTPQFYLLSAVVSLPIYLKGVGEFIAKVVVTPSGPSALLVASASVQVVVGAFLLRRSNAPFPRLQPRLIRLTTLALVLAAVTTIGYLFALSQGPAAIIVPLVATSPALGGLQGACC